MAKVVLAYTGGLATSLCIHWLRMKKGLDVVTLTANVGQAVNLEPICERATELGAEAAHIADLRERFARDYAFPALRAGAVYESGYFLGKALTRPLIVQEMARIAKDDGAAFIAHGCCGRGNDRVRFEAAAAALAPGLKVIAPLEEWGVTTREAQRRYAERYNMDFALLEDASSRQVDQNLWGIGRAHDAASIDPWAPLPEEMFRITIAPEAAPDAPEDVTIGFKSGVPTRLGGKNVRPVEMIEALARLGGKHGVGRRDVIEDRISGVKTREIYEAPAAAILFEAHRSLERLCLAKELIHFNGALSRKYAELVYEGLWFSELREGLDAFFARTQQSVTGDVVVRLYKGRAEVRGVCSPYSLYDERLARAAVECSESEAPRGLRDAVSYALKAEPRERNWRAERRPAGEGEPRAPAATPLPETRPEEGP